MRFSLREVLEAFFRPKNFNFKFKSVNCFTELLHLFYSYLQTMIGGTNKTSQGIAVRVGWGGRGKKPRGSWTRRVRLILQKFYQMRIKFNSR